MSLSCRLNWEDLLLQLGRNEQAGEALTSGGAAFCAESSKRHFTIGFAASCGMHLVVGLCSGEQLIQAKESPI